MSIHSKFAVFSLLLLATLESAAGQPYHRPYGRPYWEREEAERRARLSTDTRPTWEQWQSSDEDSPFVRREEAGTVSVRQLRRPLKGRGRDLIVKAEKLLDKGKVTEALAALEEAAELPDARPYALSILGTQHLKQNLFDQAIVELEQAAEALPENAMIHNNLAFALGVKGRTALAIKEAHKALQLDPGNAKTRFILGALLLDTPEADEAAFHLRLAAEEIPFAGQVLNHYLSSRKASPGKASQPVPAPARSFQPIGQPAGK